MGGDGERDVVGMNQWEFILLFPGCDDQLDCLHNERVDVEQFQLKLKVSIPAAGKILVNFT
jgi:hypothetical protein